MLIVPDVHGREFWKKPLEDNPEEKVVFLGDYLDPYPQEGITPGKALEVFKEILDLPKDRVTLLLGNHDLMYISDLHKRYPCRHDWERDKEITKLFKDNLERFKICHKEGKYVFSHAGIHPRWVKEHPELNLEENLWEPATERALLEISWYRGGDFDTTGSPIWCDLREWREVEVEGETQIFGHTQLVEGKIVEGKGWIGVDCKRVIKIDGDKLEIL